MTEGWLQHFQKSLAEFIQWITLAEPILSGIASVVAILTAVVGVVFFLRKQLTQSKSRQSIQLLDTFSFDIIPPRSPDVVRKLIGSSNDDPNDPLADFNIPY